MAARSSASPIQHATKKPVQGSSVTMIPSLPPTGSRSQRGTGPAFPPPSSSQRAITQEWPSNSLTSSKPNSLAPTPLPGGRRRSVSFDEAYFPQLLPPSRVDPMAVDFGDGAVSRRSTSPMSSRFSRHSPLPRGDSSLKEWETFSDRGRDTFYGRQRSFTLNTHDAPRHKRDTLGEARIRHPVLSIYKRNAAGWRGSQESCSSSEFSHLSRGYRRTGRHRHTVEDKPLKYENTYRLTPTVNFHVVEGAIQKMMARYLEDTIRRLSKDDSNATSVVRARDATNAAKGLSEAIKQQVKLKQLQRYKIVSIASICRRSGQDLVSSSQCLWETSTDGFQSVTRQSKDWFGEVTVYAVYQE